MNEETIYEATPLIEDHLSRIYANLAALFINKKEQLTKEMGIALAEDFHIV